MIAVDVPGRILPDKSNKYLRPGWNEDREKEDAGDDKGQNLGYAKAAIVMLPPIIMMMEGKHGAQIETKE